MIRTERETPEGLLVTVCDSDVLGETFDDGEFSLTVTEEFYGGEEITEEAALESLARADVANLVGVETVALAIEAGYVEEGNVLEIDGTHHAQLVTLG